MSKTSRFDWPLVAAVGFLVVLSVFILKSVAPQLFPGYFFIILLGIMVFILFSFFDFDIISLFSKHFYLGSVLLLLITLLVGKITRGAVRWIPLGALTIQAAEITKPFLLVFFANFLIGERINFRKISHTLFLMFIPFLLILVQPSLGVSFLLIIGYVGIFLAADINKKNLLFLGLVILAIVPLIYFLLAPYQKARIVSFLNPYADPLGKGYNSIQAVTTIGSGSFFGRGLGRGVQTQLAFLPEKQTDFVFAAIAEELGFLGASAVIFALFVIFWRLIIFLNNAQSPEARAFLAGLITTLLAQTVIHLGMNMGLLPITGIPLPLVSAGGSSFLATMMALGLAQGVRKV